MLKVNEKTVYELRKVLESSPRWQDAKAKGQEFYVRLGTVDEGEDFSFTFMTDTEKNPNDVVYEQHGLKFIFEESHMARLSKTTIDFINEENRVGLSFSEE